MPFQKKPLNPLALVLILSTSFFLIFLIVSGALYLYKSPSKSSSHGNGALFAGGSVGVIELNGVIMDSRKILERLERFEDEDEIKAVVLRLNSPGGAVAPSQEIYQAVHDYKKPLVVSMSSIAASGAFYVACGAKKVFANPGTITGSIGVIMEFANLQKLYEWAKIQRYSIKTGKYKDAGAEYREMTSDEKSLLQGMVDDVLVQFKKAVSAGRGLPFEKVSEVADGRIFSGSQAKALKLVDELGTLQDAINEAGKLAKIHGKPNVIYPGRSGMRWIEKLIDSGSGDEESQETPVSPASSVTHGGIVGAIGQLLGVSPGTTVALPPGIYWLWSGAH